MNGKVCPQVEGYIYCQNEHEPHNAQSIVRGDAKTTFEYVWQLRFDLVWTNKLLFFVFCLWNKQLCREENQGVIEHIIKENHH